MSRRLTLVERGRFTERLDDSWTSYFMFQWRSDKHRSYLEHLTGHNEFTKRGIHFVGWLDTAINISGRAELGWKMLVFACISTLATANIVNDWTGVDLLDEGISETTVQYITFGLIMLQTFRVGQSYSRWNDARMMWGAMGNAPEGTAHVRPIYPCCSTPLLELPSQLLPGDLGVPCCLRSQSHAERQSPILLLLRRLHHHRR